MGVSDGTMLGEIRFTIQPLHLVRRGATDPLGVGVTSATLPLRRGETPHLLGSRAKCRSAGDMGMDGVW